jgi:hypothetical protein
MISARAATLLFVILACAAGAVALGARGQTPRPGDMTQARVWVENRQPNETIPVAIQTVAVPVRVQLDPSAVVLTKTAAQGWEYRSIPLASDADPARSLLLVGNEGWEAVGVLQSGPAGVTVLLKRPR